ncbi:MAG TPA: hypothetical protein VGI64_05910 [Streptosporangiaceae bacterium]
MRLVSAPSGSRAEPDSGPGTARSLAPWLVVAGYLAAALLLTWRLWADPASRAEPGDLPDVEQMTWFIRYAASAVAHGHLPALMTTAMNPPQGVNLTWNTSILLPGVLLTPVTLLAGPQVSLTLLLTLGFAGSAASLFFVLRAWGASTGAGALGGAVYGFSLALVNSGMGHFHVQFAVLPPLIIHALLRILTGRGSPVRAGLWLGLLTAAQLFTGEELLIDTAVAAAVLVGILAASRPRQVLTDARPRLAGLATAAGLAVLLCASGLWVQFHGGAGHAGGGTTIIEYNGHLTGLYAIPYALVTPPSGLLLHIPATAAAAARYPQPQAEYLAYLGWPLIIALIAAAVLFWRRLPVRVTAVTAAVLEIFSLGGHPIQMHVLTYPARLLPWFWLQGLPGLSSALPDRLAVLADGAAGAALAFSLDLAFARLPRSWSRRRARTVTAVAVAVVLLPLVPAPLPAVRMPPVPAGWQAAFRQLHLKAGARVLVVPVPWGGYPMPLRWQAVTGEPGSVIAGDFISPYVRGRRSRAGRAGQTPTTVYLDSLAGVPFYGGPASPPAPTTAQLRADFTRWDPAAVVAAASQASPVARYLTGLLGPPGVRAGAVLAWRLLPGAAARLASPAAVSSAGQPGPAP